MIKKADILLLVILLAIGAAVTSFSLAGNVSGETVRIAVNGETYGLYSLAEDAEIDVVQDTRTNHITIKNGAVSMVSSNCLNKVCVHTGAISCVNDIIVCLPHRLTVEILPADGEEAAFDAITK